MEFVHKSILLDEVIENLNIREDGCYVDGTLGGAGHSYQICTHLGEKGRLVGIDQDADAIQAATKRLINLSCLPISPHPQNIRGKERTTKYTTLSWFCQVKMRMQKTTPLLRLSRRSA